ncbi:hypothetical protein ATANTOWER_018743 [Ataeniobius toweri]|uniref:Uncharacterized protein n=1 Tax=Ataeniobius toweri TaxID=208326 RepID=A0ABU7BV09_9TELE|nr:hypothetical protein [Ataeniobius toweri]
MLTSRLHYKINSFWFGFLFILFVVHFSSVASVIIFHRFYCVFVSLFSSNHILFPLCHCHHYQPHLVHLFHANQSPCSNLCHALRMFCYICFLLENTFCHVIFVFKSIQVTDLLSPACLHLGYSEPFLTAVIIFKFFMAMTPPLAADVLFSSPSQSWSQDSTRLPVPEPKFSVIEIEGADATQALAPTPAPAPVWHWNWFWEKKTQIMRRILLEIFSR